MRSVFLVVAVSLVCSVASAAQPEWKEYKYPLDGFALTAPDKPYIHPDANIPDATVYTVHFYGDVVFSLRVMRKPHDCAETIAVLRDGAKAGKQPGIILSSIKEFSVGGHPGVEYEFKASPVRQSYERYYCVDQRFYVFAVGWPAGNPLPSETTRIIKSFRLIRSK